MSSSSRPTIRHRRSSSTSHETSAVTVAPSLLFPATEIFTPEHKERQPSLSARRSSSTNDLKYTFSFRRSEYIDPWQRPPTYDSITPKQPDTPSYTLSHTRRRSRSSSIIPSPLQPMQTWTPASNSSSRQRALSSPVSPIISPLSSTDAPSIYQPHRPHHASLPQQMNVASPVNELPSPFASPLFYWTGQSRQELTATERMRKAQLEDLSLMSPFGSPSFYWDGVSRQEDHGLSTLDRAKRVWEKLGLHRLGAPK
jgi:hypothetical protein